MKNFNISPGLTLLVVLAISSALWLGAALPADGAVAVAKVLKVHNSVDVQKGGAGQWVAAKPGTLLEEGDMVRTAKGAKALFVLPDGSQGAINQGTKVKVGANFFKVFFGEIWMMVRPKQGFHVETPGAVAGIQGTELDVQVAETGESTLTVIDGKVKWENPGGAVEVLQGQQSAARAGGKPGAIRQLPKESLLAMVGWSDLGNPVVMVAVEETNMGKAGSFSLAEGQLNKALEESRYHLVDAGQMEKLKARDIAKVFLQEENVAAASVPTVRSGYEKPGAPLDQRQAAQVLGNRLGADLLLVGKVQTQLLTKLDEGLVSSIAYGQFRLIVAATGQLLFTRDFSAKAVSLSPEAAGLDAIKKVSLEMAKTLAWDIPQYYGFEYAGESSTRTIQVVVTRCDFSARNKVIEVLKGIPGISTVYPRSFEEPVAIIDVETTASAEEIAAALDANGTIALKIKEVALTRLAVEVKP